MRFLGIQHSFFSRQLRFLELSGFLGHCYLLYQHRSFVTNTILSSQTFCHLVHNVSANILELGGRPKKLFYPRLHFTRLRERSRNPGKIVVFSLRIEHDWSLEKGRWLRRVVEPLSLE